MARQWLRRVRRPRPTGLAAEAMAISWMAAGPAAPPYRTGGGGNGDLMDGGGSGGPALPDWRRRQWRSHGWRRVRRPRPTGLAAGRWLAGNDNLNPEPRTLRWHKPEVLPASLLSKYSVPNAASRCCGGCPSPAPRRWCSPRCWWRGRRYAPGRVPPGSGRGPRWWSPGSDGYARPVRG